MAIGKEWLAIILYAGPTQKKGEPLWLSLWVNCSVKELRMLFTELA
jgi:hypothetical protein